MPSLSESFRKLFSKPNKQQPVDDLDALPGDFFPGASAAPPLENPVDLAQIAYQAGGEERPLHLEERGSVLQSDAPLVTGFPQGSFPRPGESGLDLPSAPEENATIPGLYETWVELEERVKRAQNELQAILATREEAAILRGRAQKRLDEGEAIRADAQRISESAWRAFDRGFGVSAKGGLPSRWTTVREIR